MIDNVTTAKGCKLLVFVDENLLASNSAWMLKSLLEDEMANSSSFSDRYKSVFLYRLTFGEAHTSRRISSVICFVKRISFGNTPEASAKTFSMTFLASALKSTVLPNSFSIAWRTVAFKSRLCSLFKAWNSNIGDVSIALPADGASVASSHHPRSNTFSIINDPSSAPFCAISMETKSLVSRSVSYVCAHTRV